MKFMALKSVNIRALKDGLSAYLRDVQHGDVLLVTDRGRVVAEVRQPTLGQSALDPAFAREQRLVERGALSVGAPNSSARYQSTGLRLAEVDIDAALAWTRGDDASDDA
jgi:antitoxin (DNA-binding transcriptional repressor) of toxin-antitoxin stability system